MDKLHVAKTIPSSKQYMSVMYKNYVKKGRCIYFISENSFTDFPTNSTYISYKISPMF